jgi:hypothetical protein
MGVRVNDLIIESLKVQGIPLVLGSEAVSVSESPRPESRELKNDIIKSCPCGCGLYSAVSSKS